MQQIVFYLIIICACIWIVSAAYLWLWLRRAPAPLPLPTADPPHTTPLDLTAQAYAPPSEDSIAALLPALDAPFTVAPHASEQASVIVAPHPELPFVGPSHANPFAPATPTPMFVPPAPQASAPPPGAAPSSLEPLIPLVMPVPVTPQYAEPTDDTTALPEPESLVQPMPSSAVVSAPVLRDESTPSASVSDARDAFYARLARRSSTLGGPEHASEASPATAPPETGARETTAHSPAGAIEPDRALPPAPSPLPLTPSRPMIVPESVRPVAREVATATAPNAAAATEPPPTPVALSAAPATAPLAPQARAMDGAKPSWLDRMLKRDPARPEQPEVVTFPAAQLLEPEAAPAVSRREQPTESLPESSQRAWGLCPDCRGRDLGGRPGSTCQTCHGLGVLHGSGLPLDDHMTVTPPTSTRGHRRSVGSGARWEPCPECNGAGHARGDDGACSTCHGLGSVWRHDVDLVPAARS